MEVSIWGEMKFNDRIFKKDIYCSFCNIKIKENFYSNSGSAFMIEIENDCDYIVATVCCLSCLPKLRTTQFYNGIGDKYNHVNIITLNMQGDVYIKSK